MSQWWANMAVGIGSRLLVAITPTLRGMLTEFAQDFYKRAKETPNPFDDIVAGLLMVLLGLHTK